MLRCRTIEVPTEFVITRQRDNNNRGWADEITYICYKRTVVSVPSDASSEAAALLPPQSCLVLRFLAVDLRQHTECCQSRRGREQKRQ
jgi:hypothetical protein